MQQTDISAEPPQLQCETCIKEIPESEVNCSEAGDYFAHYCGLDCYQRWREESEAHRRQTN